MGKNEEGIGGQRKSHKSGKRPKVVRAVTPKVSRDPPSGKKTCSERQFGGKNFRGKRENVIEKSEK